MKKSKDKQVQEFLNELKKSDSKKYQILQKLRSIVLIQYPQANEKIMYGGIMFSLEKDFCGLFVNKNHISFEFGNGYQFNDPQKLLEGNGKYRRHLKIKSPSDIESKKVAVFVKQAY